MKRTIILILTLVLILSFIACGKKKEAVKNIELLQKENGIPVRTIEISPKPFIQELVYNAPVTGIEESTVKAMVSDVVLNVKAKVGDYVKKDQVVITFPQDTPMAQYEQANSAFLNAKKNYERMQRLFAQGAISQQDMDNVTTGYNVSKANLNASSQMIYYKAPISGYITAMKINTADYVNVGDPLFVVTNTSKYKADIWVTVSEIKLLKKGIKAVSKWSEQTLTGRVNSVSLAMDQDKKAFKVEVIFDTIPKQIISGITLEIKLEVSRINDALVVERKSILVENGNKYVWLEKDNKAIKTEIVTKNDNGIEYEVVSGLKAGDRLIIEGISLLTDNCLVKTIK